MAVRGYAAALAVAMLMGGTGTAFAVGPADDGPAGAGPGGTNTAAARPGRPGPGTPATGTAGQGNAAQGRPDQGRPGTGGARPSPWRDDAYGYVMTTRGRFSPPAAFVPSAALTYDQALVPAGSRIEVSENIRANGSTTVSLEVTGLHPGHDFVAHVHQRPCGADPDSSGGHYQNEPSPDPSAANADNEVWLPFTTDDQGHAKSIARHRWGFRIREAASLVIHDARNNARVGCVTVPFGWYLTDSGAPTPLPGATGGQATQPTQASQPTQTGEASQAGQAAQTGQAAQAAPEAQAAQPARPGPEIEAIPPARPADPAQPAQSASAQGAQPASASSAQLPQAAPEMQSAHTLPALAPVTPPTR